MSLNFSRAPWRTPFSQCACGEIGACVNPLSSCNCDGTPDPAARLDWGVVVDRRQLPVVGIVSGGTALPGARASVRVGALRCGPQQFGWWLVLFIFDVIGIIMCGHEVVDWRWMYFIVAICRHKSENPVQFINGPHSAHRLRAQLSIGSFSKAAHWIHISATGFKAKTAVNW